MMITFSTRQEFLQHAFDSVAKIVSDCGQSVLECSVPARDTEQCLSHLAFVANEWSYDSSLLDAMAENYRKYNDEIVQYFGDEP